MIYTSLAKHTLDTGSPAVGYSSAGATFALWSLHVNDVAAIVTATVAVVGLATNIWYKVREDRRAEERLRLQKREHNDEEKSE